MDAELSFRHVVRPRRIGMSPRWKTSRLARSRRVHRRFSSRTSRSNSFNRSRSLVVRPGRCPGRWCADAGRPPRFKPSSPSPTDAVRDGSAKLGHPVQNVTREHGLTPLPR